MSDTETVGDVFAEKQEMVDQTNSVTSATSAEKKGPLRAGMNSDYAKVPFRQFEPNTKLYATGEQNHRQENSAGFICMSIILDWPGILYEDFISAAKENEAIKTAANANMHLKWDLGHGRVRLEFADGAIEEHALFQRKAAEPKAAKEPRAPKVAAEPAEGETAPKKRGRKPKAVAESNAEATAATTGAGAVE